VGSATRGRCGVFCDDCVITQLAVYTSDDR
jgi:hypothetical protein